MNTINGNKVVTIVSDYEPFQQLGAFTIKVSSVTPEAKWEFQDLIKGLDKNDNIIVICKFLKDLLTEDQLNAIVEHEKGHIALKHLEQIPADFVGVIDNSQMELEADAYAAGIVGADMIRGALIATIGAVMNAPWLPKAHKEATGNEMLAEEITEATKNVHAALQYRYDALAAM